MQKKTCRSESCPKKRPQPLKAFPVNNASPDGRHRFCLVCCRKATADRRERLKSQGKPVRRKEAALSKKSTGTKEESLIIPHGLTGEVFRLLHAGVDTQEDLMEKTGARRDLVQIALSELLLDRKTIYSRILDDGNRHYFVLTSNQLAAARRRM